MTKNRPQQSLSGKVAIVTGAGRGLGRAEALALAAAGARVVVNDLGGGVFGGGASSEVAEAVVKEIHDSGADAVANGDDIATMDGARRLVHTALDTFGRLDILVNNAGIVRPAPIWEMTETDWDLTAAVHLKGHFATTRYAAELFKAQRGGVIINTASESGLGHWGMSNYSAAKEGIVGFTRSIARELGSYGVRCNAMRPRGVSRFATPELAETVRISQQDLGFPAVGDMWVGPDVEMPPEQVGAFVVWLCSDAAVAANGQVFVVGAGEVGIYPEPKPVRTIAIGSETDIDGVRALILEGGLLDGVENRFLGPKQETAKS